ncbi:hypothetical protein BJ742DRAFT_907818 [Cladochytrium replicatum]|nr:hypothetical protein BJ742DRAFT_907818 [Cladochytrium replicatum]
MQPIAATMGSVEEMAKTDPVSIPDEPKPTKLRRIRSKLEEDDQLPDDYDSTSTYARTSQADHVHVRHENLSHFLKERAKHSQLAKFVEELPKTEFKDSSKLVTLGSGKTLCINSKLKRGNLSAEEINDRCREQLTTKEWCPNFDRTPRGKDIEDLVTLGERTYSQWSNPTKSETEAAKLDKTSGTLVPRSKQTQL